MDDISLLVNCAIRTSRCFAESCVLTKLICCCAAADWASISRTSYASASMIIRTPQLTSADNQPFARLPLIWTFLRLRLRFSFLHTEICVCAGFVVFDSPVGLRFTRAKFVESRICDAWHRATIVPHRGVCGSISVSDMVRCPARSSPTLYGVQSTTHLR